MYDLIIQRGQVIDGSSEEARVADIGVKKGRIAALGDLARGD